MHPVIERQYESPAASPGRYKGRAHGTRVPHDVAPGLSRCSSLYGLSETLNQSRLHLGAEEVRVAGTRWMAVLRYTSQHIIITIKIVIHTSSLQNRTQNIASRQIIESRFHTLRLFSSFCVVVYMMIANIYQYKNGTLIFL